MGYEDMSPEARYTLGKFLENRGCRDNDTRLVVVGKIYAAPDRKKYEVALDSLKEIANHFGCKKMISPEDEDEILCGKIKMDHLIFEIGFMLGHRGIASGLTFGAKRHSGKSKVQVNRLKPLMEKN